MKHKDEYEGWKKGGKAYLKLAKGEKYECIYRGKEFDPKGGMKGDGALIYILEDLKDHVKREMSSSSRALDDATSRLVPGDKILIVVGTNSKGGKSYQVTLLEGTKETGGVDISTTEEEDEDEDDEEEGGKGEKIPF